MGLNKAARLVLRDSMTGPKVIWLNSRALAVLEGVARNADCPFVFPHRKGNKPINIAAWWENFRRCGPLPDVRLHDLRHNFAGPCCDEQRDTADDWAAAGMSRLVIDSHQGEQRLVLASRKPIAEPAASARSLPKSDIRESTPERT